jgi:hypothetical protein
MIACQILIQSSPHKFSITRSGKPGFPFWFPGHSKYMPAIRCCQTQAARSTAAKGCTESEGSVTERYVLCLVSGVLCDERAARDGQVVFDRGRAAATRSIPANGLPATAVPELLESRLSRSHASSSFASRLAKQDRSKSSPHAPLEAVPGAGSRSTASLHRQRHCSLLRHRS